MIVGRLNGSGWTGDHLTMPNQEGSLAESVGEFRLWKLS